VKILATMTTIPSRLSHIRPMLDSINAQTRRPDMFVLWLPEICKKENRGYDIPEWLATSNWSIPGLFNYPFVMRGVEDWGPATKLLPVLGMFPAADTLVVTLDDDVVYGPKVIETLASAAESDKFPGSALGLVGVKDKQYIHGEQLRKQGIGSVVVDVLGGYRAVAYPAPVLDKTMLEDAEELLKDGPFVLDDHLFSWNLRRRGIPRVVVEAPTDTWTEGDGAGFLLKNLGNGVYDEGGNRKLVDDSMRKIRDLYDRNGWQKD